jgi:hypothetical protein
MEKNMNEKNGGKREYDKPQVKVIELATDEVLAVGCKTITGVAAGFNPSCGLAVSCNVLGS